MPRFSKRANAMFLQLVDTKIRVPPSLAGARIDSLIAVPARAQRTLIAEGLTMLGDLAGKRYGDLAARGRLGKRGVLELHETLVRPRADAHTSSAARSSPRDVAADGVAVPRARSVRTPQSASAQTKWVFGTGGLSAGTPAARGRSIASAIERAALELANNLTQIFRRASFEELAGLSDGAVVVASDPKKARPTPLSHRPTARSVPEPDPTPTEGVGPPIADPRVVLAWLRLHRGARLQDLLDGLGISASSLDPVLAEARLRQQIRVVGTRDARYYAAPMGGSFPKERVAAEPVRTRAISRGAPSAAVLLDSIRRVLDEETDGDRRTSVLRALVAQLRALQNSLRADDQHHARIADAFADIRDAREDGRIDYVFGLTPTDGTDWAQLAEKLNANLANRG